MSQWHKMPVEIAMLKRSFLWLIALLLCAIPLSVGAAKSYSAERFDVDWNLTESGLLEVTETVVFKFAGGPFTFVYRDLPTAYSDGIWDIEASLDGQPMPKGSQAGQVEIEWDNPIKVTWHFAPTSDSTHTFQLNYRVAGVIRSEANADLFWWNALPTEYEYTIGSATVRLTYPSGIQPIGPPEVRRGAAQVAQEAGQVIWSARDIRPNTPLTVALPFPRHSLAAAPPDWQAREESAERAMPGFLAAAGAVLLGGIGALWAIWARGRRPETALGPATLPSSILPDRSAPAVAGTLVAPNAKPGPAQALATLFSLAQRGVLVIEESPEKRWYRPHEFTVRLVDGAPRNLRPHERELLDLLFTTKTGRTDAIKLSEVGTRLTSKLSRFSQPLTEELQASGLIDGERQATANRFMIIGVGLIVMMIPLGALAVVLMPRAGGWPFLLVAVAFLLGVAAFILASAYSPLSDEGERQAARWRGFEKYLKEVTKGREPAWDLKLFDEYLPYAAAFGLTEGWAKAFQKRGGAEIPPWFRALAGAQDGGVAAFVAMTSAARSAGASGTGGAGGGGAGGGGGSGAG